MAGFTEIQLNEYGAKIQLSNGRLLQHLDSYVEFINNDYPVIVNFFIGNIDFVSVSNVQKLDNLILVFNDISNKIILNSFKFNMYIEWEITEYLESLKLELFRISKTSKFLRSSRTNYNFTGRLEIPTNLAQNQTLEDVTAFVQNNSDYDNRWIDLALRNDLSEIQYDHTGGNRIVVGFQISSRNFSINSVIDNIIGSRILGLDIQRLIEFSDDDLKVLDYNSTAIQSVEILANLKKGDVPEFKDFGVSNVVGTSSNSYRDWETDRKSVV